MRRLSKIFLALDGFGDTVQLMSTSDLDIEPELNSLLSKLTIEIANDNKEIEVRKKRIEKNETLLRAVRASLTARSPDASIPGYGSKIEKIKDAISRIPKVQFLQDDVEAELRRTHPDLEINRTRIRSALWTMAVDESGPIQIAQKGSNKAPAIYSKKSGSDNNKSQEHAPHQQLKPKAISANMLEDAVRKQSGRISHFERRLGTDESTIKVLLEPASKVYIDVGGWLRVRE